MIDFFERVAALRRDGRSFAVATVVARRAPVSAHLGDRAIIFADGRMDGFVGGACSRELVRQQALEALAARQGRLVSIRPDGGDRADSTPEHVVVPMTCASEGAIDVYVDPFVPARTLIVVGDTPVAAALARLARSMDYDVVRVVDAREQADIEPASAAIGVTVVPLGELARVAGERAGRGGRRGRIPGALRRGVARGGAESRRGVRRPGRVAQARGHRSEPARGGWCARRRFAAKPGGARPRRAHTARRWRCRSSRKSSRRR